MSEESVRIAGLNRLLAVTREMAVTTDLAQLLRQIVDAACATLNCERATIFLFDRKRNELYSRVATGEETIRFAADRGIAGAVAQSRQIVNVADAYADTRFNQDIDRRTGFVTRNLLTAPVEDFQGALVGVLQLLNKRNGPFDCDDEALLGVLTAQAGVALQRQFLLEAYAEQRRMARDLELARQIQQRLFPKADPQIPGYAVAGWNRSADETGGDCYDFLALDDGRLALLLADATGHGIGAALVIAQCRALIRAMLSVSTDLATVAAQVNVLLSEDLEDDRFVTTFLGVLDPQRHRLEYVSAGQGPLLFLTSAGYEMRSATSIPFGIWERGEFPSESFDFTPGATLALLTDGFYEASTSAGDLFGAERVVRVIQKRPDATPAELIRDLHAAVEAHTGGRPQADDLTAIVVRRMT